jgi:hypothetical protein
MGYRSLLKAYMAHVEAITSTNLVELAALTNAFNKRDLGELRTVAAELKRESFAADAPTNHNYVVGEMLRAGELRLDQLDRLSGIETSSQDEQIPEEMLRRIIRGLVETN